MESRISGIVFDIEKFAIHDGPGIRTAVFMKGCPLHCLWCHNPESQRYRQEIFFNPEKCVGCGWCFQNCPQGCHVAGEKHLFDRTNCLRCGRCAEKCPSDALEVVGKTMSPEEVIAEVLKDKVFYETSGGGVTFSGGEPMVQFEFLLAMLKRAKSEGLHVCIETCGYAPQERFAQILPYIDLFLYDIKASDPELHKRFTGVDNSLILENLRFIGGNGGKIVLRCPLIPGVNDDSEHLSRIAELAEEIEGVVEVNVEPYHPLGVGKHLRLGTESALPIEDFTDDSLVTAWIEEIQSKTAKAVKKG